MSLQWFRSAVVTLIKLVLVFGRHNVGADFSDNCDNSPNSLSCIHTYEELYNSLAKSENSFNIESAIYPSRRPSSVRVFVNLHGPNETENLIVPYTWSLSCFYVAVPPLLLEVLSLGSILVTPRTQTLNITIPYFCCNVSKKENERRMIIKERIKRALASFISYRLKNRAKLRTHMSCKAAILVLFNFSSARKGEEAAAARDLWCQLVDILVNVAPTSESLQQQANRDSSAYPCPTVSGPPAHLLEPTTPVNSTVPGPPAHLHCCTQDEVKPDKLDALLPGMLSFLAVLFLIPALLFASPWFNGRENAYETVKTILMTALATFIWLTSKKLLGKKKKSEEKVIDSRQTLTGVSISDARQPSSSELSTHSASSQNSYYSCHSESHPLVNDHDNAESQPSNDDSFISLSQKSQACGKMVQNSENIEFNETQRIYRESNV
ncbi:hypothetical protein pdam_00023378 [Pocillopora damicornis]|uniref:Uncharacterized protein n=1 Tax=Pocillopora damicornis TaxID=46731 RepID=A0A3M6TRJ5_POCDA|nr:hypothetical protein pdam_00023378 [Pocillopora damicornis]